MRIERLDLSAGAGDIAACYEAYQEGRAFDDPLGPATSYRAFEFRLRHGWPDDSHEAWLARDPGGAVAAWYTVDFPRLENPHLAGLNVMVRPSRRRTGLGTAMLRHAAERARRAGRKALAGDAREGAAGPAFARSLGARTGLTDIRRVQEVGPVPAALRAEVGRATVGYSLVSWVGPAPEGYLPSIVAVVAAMADMPRDAGREPGAWDADRIRRTDQIMAQRGDRCYAVAARAVDGGELAAMTQIAVDPDLPEWGDQALTVVAGPHRGRRLGLAVKIGMLDLLAAREPGLRRIITWNADANQHMIAINERLGYRVLDRWISLELDLPD